VKLPFQTDNKKINEEYQMAKNKNNEMNVNEKGRMVGQGTTKNQDKEKSGKSRHSQRNQG
jgi:hypothetical protein